jgi:SAM-dependent methyltransferase
MLLPMQTLREAWDDALHARQGVGGPGIDFTTSATEGDPRLPVLADALARLCAELDLTTVLDVGCGDGGLARALGARGLDARGVDLGDALPVTFDGLIVAHELLDDVPCPVVLEGRELLADGTLGPPASDADLAWLRQWWPASDCPAEVGRPRDELWSSLVARLGRGLAVCIDYGHARSERRPTLTEHDGWWTAHVALDSLKGSLTPDALERLGVSPAGTLAERALLATPTAWVVAGAGGLRWPT